jgi:hypothetical protein
MATRKPHTAAVTQRPKVHSRRFGSGLHAALSTAQPVRQRVGVAATSTPDDARATKPKFSDLGSWERELCTRSPDNSLAERRDRRGRARTVAARHPPIATPKPEPTPFTHLL